MKLKASIVFLLGLLSFAACKEDTLPKPKAMLRLEYPKGATGLLEVDRFQFQYNSLATIETKNKTALTLDYPMMKGAIFITYKEVDGNLNELLSDAQKLVYEHVVKADNILPKEFINTENKVYGMFYQIEGDAASQSQFYVTDSIHHFVTGSLHFKAIPNYDSIYPAAKYLQKDIRQIMETLEWKN